MSRRRTLPDLLTDAELDALFASIPSRSFTSIRNRAAFALMRWQGLRVSEVTGLTPRRVRWNAGDIKVMGKGSRERLLPLVAEARLELERWRAIRPSSTWFLCTRSGGQVCRNYLNKALARYADRARSKPCAAHLAGLDHVHCHMLRHGFATALLRQTGNLELVRKALGHSSTKTTSIYVHLTTDDLREAMCGAESPAGPGIDEPHRQVQILELQQQLVALQQQLDQLMGGQGS